MPVSFWRKDLLGLQLQDKIMQQLLPDIKTLYQRKYLQPTSFPPDNISSDPREYLLQRAQRFQEVSASTSKATKKQNYIKIIKETPSQHRTRTIRGRTAALPTARGPSPQLKQQISSHSSAAIPPRRDLMQQILQISHQELIDLQSSMGGEKTLMGLLNVFFQKRHERQIQGRTQRAKSEFKPMQNLLTKRYQDEEKVKQFRIKKEEVIREERRKEKELAPWSVQEIEFI